MMYVAYNNTKGAYLFLDSCKHWSLTGNYHTAHATAKEKLMSIISQCRNMPNDWSFFPMVDGKICKESAKPNPIEAEKPVVHGEWTATQEYNELLDSVQKFSQAVNKQKAIELAADVSKINAEIIDMEHFIEFSELDNDAMCNTYIKLRELFRRRRDVKQLLELANRILDSGVRQLVDGHTFPAPAKTVKKMYTPRGDGQIFNT